VLSDENSVGVGRKEMGLKRGKKGRREKKREKRRTLYAVLSCFHIEF
jgi:hypothetical protein